MPQYQVVKAHFGGSTWPLSRWGIHTDIGVYIGLITLVVNLVVVGLLTVVLRTLRVSPNVDYTRPEDYLADGDLDGMDRMDFLLDGTPQSAGAHSQRRPTPQRDRAGAGRTRG